MTYAAELKILQQSSSNYVCHTTAPRNYRYWHRGEHWSLWTTKSCFWEVRCELHGTV